jgi:inner membrane protein
MTGVTHQTIALLAALWLLTTYPVSLGPSLGIAAVVAVMIGALTPDLDQPTANVWRRMLGGRAIGNIFQAFSGGHRHLTHSLVGIFAIGWLLQWAIFRYLNPEFFANALVLWYAFMVGYISHPMADTLTDRGVPWFWPFHWHLRIPPGPEEVRVTTGSFVEIFIVRGAVVISALLLLSTHWQTVIRLFR